MAQIEPEVLQRLATEVRKLPRVPLISQKHHAPNEVVATEIERGAVSPHTAAWLAIERAALHEEVDRLRKIVRTYNGG